MDRPINCAGCGLPIGAEETLWCRSRTGTFVAARLAQIRRLLSDREPAELFHLRCFSAELDQCPQE